MLFVACEVHEWLRTTLCQNVQPYEGQEP